MRLEQNAHTTLGCYWRARDVECEFTRTPKAAHHERDMQFPPRGSDGSWNFAPAFAAARGDWQALDRLLDEHWAAGGDNEFLSPLYGNKIYVAACLGALLGGGREAWLRMHRLTAMWSLLATVGRPRTRFILWAGKIRRVKHLTRHGVLVPTAGCRINGGVVVESWLNGALAHALGIEHAYVRDRWKDYDPPSTESEWNDSKGGNAPQPWAAVETLRAAERTSGIRLADAPWNRLCARAVQGSPTDRAVIEDALRTGDSRLRLPRGCRRLLVERKDQDVLVALEGRLWTRQKPSIAACAIRDGVFEVLLPAPWKIPGPPTACLVGNYSVSADVAAALEFSGIVEMRRLEDPDAAWEFFG